MTEHQEQVSLFAWLRLRYPGVLAFAIPNGGHRNVVTAAKLKAEGVKAGVPDLMLAEPRQGYHGLFVEMKKPGGRPSPEQKIMLEELARRGYRTALCQGFNEAQAAIENYLQED